LLAANCDSELKSRLGNIVAGALTPGHEVMAFDEEYGRGLRDEICCD
jgi:hypothetical protein